MPAARYRPACSRTGCGLILRLGCCIQPDTLWAGLLTSPPTRPQVSRLPNRPARARDGEQEAQSSTPSPCTATVPQEPHHAQDGVNPRHAMRRSLDAARRNAVALGTDGRGRAAWQRGEPRTRLESAARRLAIDALSRAGAALCFRHFNVAVERFFAAQDVELDGRDVAKPTIANDVADVLLRRGLPLVHAD